MHCHALSWVASTITWLILSKAIKPLTATEINGDFFSISLTSLPLYFVQSLFISITLTIASQKQICIMAYTAPCWLDSWVEVIILLLYFVTDATNIINTMKHYFINLLICNWLCNCITLGRAWINPNRLNCLGNLISLQAYLIKISKCRFW